MTTGLQSIAVHQGMFGKELECAFLPGSRADGCLLIWSPTNRESVLEEGEAILNRNGKDKVRGKLSLAPGTYEILGFGLLNNNTLHNFPLSLQINITSAGNHMHQICFSVHNYMCAYIQLRISQGSEQWK